MTSSGTSPWKTPVIFVSRTTTTGSSTGGAPEPSINLCAFITVSMSSHPSMPSSYRRRLVAQSLVPHIRHHKEPATISGTMVAGTVPSAQLHGSERVCVPDGNRMTTVDLLIPVAAPGSSMQ
jgi:hypothetical protein